MLLYSLRGALKVAAIGCKSTTRHSDELGEEKQQWQC